MSLRKFFGFACCFGALCAFSSIAVGQSIFSSGHGDMGVAYEDEDGPGGNPPELYIHWHIEGGVVDGTARADEEFDPGDLKAIVNSNFILDRPADAAWDPIGNDADDPIWFLPQSDSGPTGAAATGKPFFGWAAEEEIEPGDWGNDFGWEITGFNGPGEFSVWQNGLTPTFFLSTADNLLQTDGPTLGGHDHFNWGFTALGEYEIEFTVSGTHNTDGFQSDTGVFRFSVVPEPGSFAVLASLGMIGLVSRRRKA